MEQGEAKLGASTPSAPHWSPAATPAPAREPEARSPGPLLVPRETCWRIEQAERVSVLVDAAAYFAVLRTAIAEARTRVIIVGWDVDSRTQLCASGRAADGLPAQLLPFLRAVLRRRPELHVYILSWDFSVIYTLEREWLPSFVFSHAHPRLHYVLDSAHVVGASQHQKLVVIDDNLAFTGGIDLTIRRWDRPDHRVDDNQRRDPDGEPYAPMHDVQVAVSGPAARALAQLARERWRSAAEGGHGGHPAAISDTLAPAHGLWPEGLAVDFSDVPVGISRTGSGTNERPVDIHEIALLTFGAFETAQRYIYVENQYFTASAAARALAKSLERPDGPEVILVLPVLESGWLEQSSMGVLKRQVLAHLRKSDRHGRLHIYYPQLPHAEHGLHIHCKLLISDDRVLKVGSANLSNRSLGLDTECDLTIEAQAPDQALSARIQRVLVRLLSEHLDLSEDACAERLAAHGGSIVDLIESRRGQPRCLERFPESLPDPALDLGMLGDWAVDPERPMAGETFIAGFYPMDVKKPWLRSALASVALFVPVVILAFLFQEDMPWLTDWLQSPQGLWWAWLGYTLACSLFIPLSFTASALCLLLDAPLALGVALSGALLSCALSHAIGRAFRPLTLRFVRAQRARQLQHSARRRAFRATVIARLLPAGNFTASNLLAGALEVPFWRFMLGNLAGLSFGLTSLLLFAKRALCAIRAPSPLNFALCCGAGALMIALCYVVARAFARPHAAHQ